MYWKSAVFSPILKIACFNVNINVYATFNFIVLCPYLCLFFSSLPTSCTYSFFISSPRCSWFITGFLAPHSSLHTLTTLLLTYWPDKVGICIESFVQCYLCYYEWIKPASCRVKFLIVGKFDLSESRDWRLCEGCLF